MPKSVTIHHLPKEERPREKMITLGARNLTDRELLITLLGRGGRGESVVVTAERLLGRFRNLNRIATVPIKELTEIKGI